MRKQLRIQQGRNPEPGAGLVDSQTVNRPTGLFGDVEESDGAGACCPSLGQTEARWAPSSPWAAAACGTVAWRASGAYYPRRQHGGCAHRGPHAQVDYFVSYTSADRASAEWIAWQLKQADFSVVV